MTNTVLMQIHAAFGRRGHEGYGEGVSQLDHALQCGAFARRDGATPPLVTAAFLHDIGHLLHDLPQDVADSGVDTQHEASGSAWLSHFFGPEVTEPVRMHVAAKRYLAAVEPGYFEQLSEASKQSLKLQGGVMTPEQARAFEAEPFFADAVCLRRWDEEGKIVGYQGPQASDFDAVIASCLKKPFGAVPPPAGKKLTTHAIPQVDVAGLFGADPAARAAVDAAIQSAARNEGFMVISGLPSWAVLDVARRRQLLALFSLPEAEIRKLWRWNFDPARPNVYRGWFPLQDGLLTYKEGIDMGPDLAFGPSVVDSSDPLCEATPLPDESVLPGWRAVAREYYLAMNRLSMALMHSVARGLGLPEHSFDAAFDGGISTLRLLHYPLRSEASFQGVAPADVWASESGVPRYVLGRGHVDTGFLTLLAQDGVDGLQAQHLDGSWLDVPPREGTLAVNFGKVLERWTAGAIRATVHRVLGSGRERYSIPFFYEARVDAVIAPLPIPGAQAFEPFYFGDHLWETTTKFPEQRGIAHLRTPRGRPTAAA